MKVEIEVSDADKYGKIMTVSFVGGFEGMCINVTTAAFDLTEGTKIYMDGKGNMIQSKFEDTEREGSHD